MEKLKSCPFCGSDPETHVSYEYSIGGGLMLCFSVECNCGTKKSLAKRVRGDSFDKYIEIMNETIELWNRRA